MKQFWFTLPANISKCFKGRLVIWQLTAILLTFILVKSGFDWQYFKITRSPVLRAWMFPSAPIGGLVPILLPLILLLIGYAFKQPMTILTGWAIAQAEFIGSLVSSTYKAFTGRVHPAHDIGPDISQVFHFGFLRGGVFWGWPSSHTTIAFASAFTIWTLFPKQCWLGVVAVVYACYIGLGVSMTIHWFSDFLAGGIIGTAIGIVVGKSYSQSPS